MIPLKTLFIENFEIALKAVGIDDQLEEQYVIVPNTEDERYTTMDEIYRLRLTPGFSGIRLSYEEVISCLVNESKKVAPIWIKIYKKKDQPVLLLTSKRYRKMRDIVLRRKDVENPPFLIGEESIDAFTEGQERLEAIRILFFSQGKGIDVKHLIGPEITATELRNNFEQHFENYSSYPPFYNRVEKGEVPYASLVIDKNLEANTYSIFKNPDTGTLLKSDMDLDEAIKYYVTEALDYEICDIKLNV